MNSPVSLPTVAILGGGITGLAAALRLTRQRPEIVWRLFEASPRLGGVLETITDEANGSWLIERSADNFLTREPWGTELCRQVGLEEALLPTDASRRRALVVHQSRVLPVPEGFVLMAPRRIGQLLRSPVLSLRGKLRLACEPLIPRRRHRAGDDESVASFARRRLGREALERLVQPLVAGIYTADPERLSVAATLPQFLQQETDYGSLWRAARHTSACTEDQESGARYGLFVAPRLGMQQLVDQVVENLPTDQIALNQPVGRCVPPPEGQGKWRLEGPEGKPLGEFDAVLSTLPAYHTASLVEGFDTELAEQLRGIEYAGASVVCFGVRDEQITRPVNGFGFVVPTVEGRQTLATSFSSYKFPGRAPEGCTLIRTFVGGAMQPELADRDDAELIQIVSKELGELIGLQGKPLLTRIVRWPRRMPQYHVGHLGRVAQIEQRVQAWPGLRLAGAAYHGVGVPQCIHSGEQAADQLG